MNLTVQLITASHLASFNKERDIKVIGGFDSEVEAIEFTALNKPSIILLDYEIEKENTELFVSSLLNESSGSRVILFGTNLSDDTILSCLLSGLYGYMEWRDIDKFLIKAIRSVGMGEAWVSRRLVGLLLEKLRG